MNVPGTNTGHGHIWARPDGMRARCGGSVLCQECAADQAAINGGGTTLTEIEQYAISLVHEGAAHCAQDDMGEEAEHLTEKQWREACDLGIQMAIAIVNNRESFLAWYRQVSA